MRPLPLLAALAPLLAAWPGAAQAPSPAAPVASLLLPGLAETRALLESGALDARGVLAERLAREGLPELAALLAAPPAAPPPGPPGAGGPGAGPRPAPRDAPLTDFAAAADPSRRDAATRELTRRSVLLESARQESEVAATARLQATAALERTRVEARAASGASAEAERALRGLPGLQAGAMVSIGRAFEPAGRTLGAVETAADEAERAAREATDREGAARAIAASLAPVSPAENLRRLGAPVVSLPTDRDPRLLVSLASVAATQPGPLFNTNRTDPPRSLSELRVWGAPVAEPDAYEDVVAVLGEREGEICTGTLVAPDLVLTAAHCLCGGVAHSVVVGRSLGWPKRRVAVRRDASAPLRPCGSYDPRTYAGGDLALLRLAEPVEVPRRPLADPEAVRASPMVRVVGFGLTAVGQAGAKHFVDLGVASPDCSGTVPHPAGLVAGPPDERYYGCAPGVEMVAGGLSRSADSCKGDSGGPAFVLGPDARLHLAATVSRGLEGRGACGNGGIYVRLAGEAADWLRHHGAGR